MRNTLTLQHVRELTGLGQVSPLDAALSPILSTLKSKMAELAGPAAKQAADAAVPVIRAELERQVPLFALIAGAAIGLSMLIGTQLPRWHIGGRS